MATKRKVIVTASFVPGKGGPHLRKFDPEPVDVYGVPQPAIPKAVRHRRADGALLAFDGQSIRVELTGDIKGKGNAPVVVAQEYEARRPMTALDPAPLGTMTVPFIVTQNAELIHDVLMARCAAGHVMRVYGPMSGPYEQGDVWAFAGMPEPEVLMPMNPDGTLRAFKMVLELQEWNPMGSLKPQKGSRVGSDEPRKKAAKVTKKDRAARELVGRNSGFIPGGPSNVGDLLK